MKNKLEKKVENDGSVYYVDEQRRVQGIVENRYEGELISIETYKDNILHGKTESFLAGGGSEVEYFFCGTSIGTGKEGEEKFNQLNKADLVKQRLEVNLKKFPEE